MAASLTELRERLLRAGVAPRYVRRYLAELADHLADLTAEEQLGGRSELQARPAALARLGSIDELAQSMIGQRQFQSWSARAPWAMFGLAPLLVLACAYSIACFILWSGWKIFLPSTQSPFVPIHGLAIAYFGAGKLLYFGAPVLVGWGIGLTAARQRLQPFWPCVGLLVTAWIAGSARVHASRPPVPGSVGNISMEFASTHAAQFLVVLCLVVLPYLIWRLQSARSAAA
jgi:hypothetical protein